MRQKYQNKMFLKNLSSAKIDLAKDNRSSDGLKMENVEGTKNKNHKKGEDINYIDEEEKTKNEANVSEAYQADSKVIINESKSNNDLNITKNDVSIEKTNVISVKDNISNQKKSLLANKNIGEGHDGFILEGEIKLSDTKEENVPKTLFNDSNEKITVITSENIDYRDKIRSRRERNRTIIFWGEKSKLEISKDDDNDKIKEHSATDIGSTFTDNTSNYVKEEQLKKDIVAYMKKKNEDLSKGRRMRSRTIFGNGFEEDIVKISQKNCEERDINKNEDRTYGEDIKVVTNNIEDDEFTETNVEKSQIHDKSTEKRIDDNKYCEKDRNLMNRNFVEQKKLQEEQVIKDLTEYFKNNGIEKFERRRNRSRTLYEDEIVKDFCDSKIEDLKTESKLTTNSSDKCTFYESNKIIIEPLNSPTINQKTQEFVNIKNCRKLEDVNEVTIRTRIPNIIAKCSSSVDNDINYHVSNNPSNLESHSNSLNTESKISGEFIGTYVEEKNLNHGEDILEEEIKNRNGDILEEKNRNFSVKNENQCTTKSSLDNKEFEKSQSSYEKESQELLKSQKIATSRKQDFDPKMNIILIRHNFYSWESNETRNVPNINDNKINCRNKRLNGVEEVNNIKTNTIRFEKFNLVLPKDLKSNDTMKVEHVDGYILVSGDFSIVQKIEDYCITTNKNIDRMDERMKLMNDKKYHRTYTQENLLSIYNKTENNIEDTKKLEKIPKPICKYLVFHCSENTWAYDEDLFLKELQTMVKVHTDDEVAKYEKMEKSMDAVLEELKSGNYFKSYETEKRVIEEIKEYELNSIIDEKSKEAEEIEKLTILEKIKYFEDLEKTKKEERMNKESEKFIKGRSENKNNINVPESVKNSKSCHLLTDDFEATMDNSTKPNAIIQDEEKMHCVRTSDIEINLHIGKEISQKLEENKIPIKISKCDFSSISTDEPESINNPEDTIEIQIQESDHAKICDKESFTGQILDNSSSLSVSEQKKCNGSDLKNQENIRIDCAIKNTNQKKLNQESVYESESIEICFIDQKKNESQISENIFEEKNFLPENGDGSVCGFNPFEKYDQGIYTKERTMNDKDLKKFLLFSNLEDDPVYKEDQLYNRAYENRTFVSNKDNGKNEGSKTNPGEKIIYYQNLTSDMKKEFAIFCSKRLKQRDGSNIFKKAWRSIKKIFVSEDDNKYYKPKTIRELVFEIGSIIKKKGTEVLGTFRNNASQEFFYVVPYSMQEENLAGNKVVTYRSDEKYRRYGKSSSENDKKHQVNESGNKKKNDDEKQNEVVKKNTGSCCGMKKESLNCKSADDERAFENQNVLANSGPITENNKNSGIKQSLYSNENPEVINEDTMYEILRNTSTTWHKSHISDIPINNLVALFKGYINNVLKGLFPKSVMKTIIRAGNPETKKHYHNSKIDETIKTCLPFCMPENERTLLLYTFSIWTELEKNITKNMMDWKACANIFGATLFDNDFITHINEIKYIVNVLYELYSNMDFKRIDPELWKKFMKVYEENSKKQIE